MKTYLKSSKFSFEAQQKNMIPPNWRHLYIMQKNSNSSQIILFRKNRMLLSSEYFQ